MVKSITVNLTEPVKANDETASIFTLYRSAIDPLATEQNTVHLRLRTDEPLTSTLTFDFEGTMTEANGSLVNGFYNLNIDSTKAAVVGDLDGLMSPDHGDSLNVTGSLSNKLFRLAGDSNGDGMVNKWISPRSDPRMEWATRSST